jgi:hypothetical protein
VFVFYEFAVEIELLELGLFLCEVVVVFSEAEGFAIETGERVEEANVVEGIGLEFVILEDAKDFGESDLDEGFLEFRAVGESGHVGAVFAKDAKLVAPLLVAEVILVTAFAPFGEVFGFKVFGVIAELFDDLRVGAAIVDVLVDLVAEGFGEAGDFAVALVTGRDSIFDFRFWILDLGRRRGIS